MNYDDHIQQDPVQYWDTSTLENASEYFNKPQEELTNDELESYELMLLDGDITPPEMLEPEYWEER